MIFYHRWMKLRPTSLGLILIFTLSFDFCTPSCRSIFERNAKCPKGFVQVYSNQGMNMGWITLCCEPGPDADNQALYARGCKRTICIASGKTVECKPHTTLPNKYVINGKTLVYEEVARDQCKGDDGQIGSQLVCCPTDSLEVSLTTLYGTEPYEFPHFVKLGAAGCGGTLYNSKFVLTASHCLVENQVVKSTDDESVSPVRINIDVESSYTPATYKVKQIHIHPNSSFLKPMDINEPSYNDIALLELDREVEFSDKVKALRIPEKGYNALDYGKYAVIVGYGTADSLRLQSRILKANVLLRNKDDVFSHPPFNFRIALSKAQLLPVGGIWDGKANPWSGTGDSGGPAICRDSNGNAILCGITSLTTPNDQCIKNINELTCPPALYDDVQYFNDWIKSVAGEQVEEQLFKKELFGYPAPNDEYTSQVHITADGIDGCGGTLVDKNMVLTAAHCLLQDDGRTPRNNVVVQSGLRDLNNLSQGKNHKVTSMAILEGFKLGGKGSRKKRVISLVLESWQQNLKYKPVIAETPYYQNNLVLIKLDGEALGKVAKIGGVPAENRMAKEVAFPKKGMKLGDTLSIREMKMLSRNECQKRIDRLKKIKYNVKLDNNIICGVETYSGGSLCDRELGGGLFCKGKSGDELCGVQIFRLCEFNIPNAFIDLGNPEVEDWIERAKTGLQNAS